MDAHCQANVNCQCKQCRKACQTRPGWFAFDEVEQAATSKDMTLAEFTARYLVTDEVIVTNPTERWGILSPATINETPERIRPFGHTGVCVFYRNGKCDIHDTKPAECRLIDHATTQDQQFLIKQRIAKTWIA